MTILYSSLFIIISFIDILERFQEYADLLNEFMSAVKQAYGEKVLIQVEFAPST